jgi:hypothetical protein
MNSIMSQLAEQFDRLARTTAAAAALRIIRGVEHNEPRILIGSDAKYLDLIQRLKPATYWPLLARFFDRMTV